MTQFALCNGKVTSIVLQFINEYDALANLCYAGENGSRR